jgi:hypothetical protein
MMVGKPTSPHTSAIHFAHNMSSQASVRLLLAVLVCCFLGWSLPIPQFDAFR